ncbi:hypothetical protein WJX72_000897 [[Myrmecia] bisecta]|uniref:TATA box binding protein associated factor (TAF) histone-like fold domain-containing protein n=1 Tax=[Myrmecia] bisecta TaxID=41462 RepID=A0AAW1PRM0_9CHLO
MSFVQPATIQVIADALEQPIVSDEAAKTLAPHVDVRLREIIQEALKFMRHSKRAVLTTEDLNQAFRLRNVEPVYGAGSKDPARFLRAAGHSDLFFVDDPELNVQQLLQPPLPRRPVEVGMVPHWLAVDGVQPAIPENAPLERPKAKRQRLEPARQVKQRQQQQQQQAAKERSAAPQPSAEAAVAHAASDSAAGEGPAVRPPVRHVLSVELQHYFGKVSALLRTPEKGKEGDEDGDDAKGTALQRAVLASLASDPGLHPLAPYFTQLIAEEVAKCVKQKSPTTSLLLLLKATRSLLVNEHIHIEPYLHQLMPAILTCLVARNLGAGPGDDHWSVRDAAARLVALVCGRFGDAYYNIQPRISNTLYNAFTDRKKPLTTHYGAVVGLAALGHKVVRLLLLPNLAPYARLLEEAMDPKQRNEMKRYEAACVYGALLRAACACVCHYITTARPASWQQPPESVQNEPRRVQLQKDRPFMAPVQLTITPLRSSPAAEGAAAQAGTAAAGGPEAVLADAWREDADLGKLLLAVHEVFGEAAVPWIPTQFCAAFL